MVFIIFYDEDPKRLLGYQIRSEGWFGGEGKG